MAKRKGLNDDLNRFYGLTSGDDYLAFEKEFVNSTPSKTKNTGRCFETHPPLIIPGTPHVIYGGSCSSPVVKDADVYIGFDHSMRISSKSFPWNGETTEFLFEIDDMSVPKSPKEFVKLVKWTGDQLRAGKKVHCGCIGGHGRTGTFLSALVCDMTGNTDSIKYVRENYCQKAVETQSQTKFLAEHFGIKSAEGSKSHGHKIINSASETYKKPPKGGTVTRIAPLPGYSFWD